MQKLIWIASVLAVFGVTNVYGQGASSRGENDRAVELAVSNQAVQLRYLTDAKAIGRDADDLAYGFLLSEERDVVGSAAVMVDTDIRLLPRLSIQIGPQAYAALLSEENNDVFTLAFGLQARYDLVRSRGIAIVGHAFYSPDVLTFGSADNLTDWAVRGEMRLTERLVGFAGYRWFKLNLVGLDDRDLQNQFFAGVSLPLR